MLAVEMKLQIDFWVDFLLYLINFSSNLTREDPLSLSIIYASSEKKNTQRAIMKRKKE